MRAKTARGTRVQNRGSRILFKTYSNEYLLFFFILHSVYDNQFFKDAHLDSKVSVIIFYFGAVRVLED